MVDRTGEIYLPGVDAPDGRGSPQRARLPRRKRPGDPSPGAWSTTLRQYGRGSVTEPWTTDRARPMETGVHRSGEICPPGATDPNGAGPPQRVRLPDRNRPGDSSSGAYGQTTTESAHGSGFTEPWLHRTRTALDEVGGASRRDLSPWREDAGRGRPVQESAPVRSPLPGRSVVGGMRHDIV